ncbi:hypothetical protein AVEN_57191-1 [Araneus ventricosus]|uniref:Uncharacterized protein n=1 Tax=Araneus ventricosus TaxID=182803 RepID=A0A4Y2RB93_ARAVE|nr:hypothetical protein AVEN_57191-1 [Araneus ventricosus]
MIQFSLRHGRSPPESEGRHFTGRMKRNLRPNLVVYVELLEGRDALAGMDELGLFAGMDALDLRVDTDAPGSLKPNMGFSLLMEMPVGLSLTCIL